MLRVREPGHRMFRSPEKDVHVHVHQPDDPAVTDLLDLRDRLRRSREDRALYAATKRALAGREWPDMDHYADAKSAVIAEILSRARTEVRRRPWVGFRAAVRSSLAGARCDAPAAVSRRSGRGR